MLKISALFTILLALSTANADQSWLSNLAFGPSAPQGNTADNIQLSNTSYDPGGQPTRISGGERITIQFRDSATGKIPTALPIESVRILGFSKSGTGAVMVHAVNAVPVQDPNFFDPLFLFSSISPTSKAQGKDGRVMVGAGDSVFLQFASVINFNSMAFTLESWGSDDASAVLQFIWHGANPKSNQLITRQIINYPVTPGGGNDPGGGGGTSNSCQSTEQCSSEQNCMNGQCVDVSSQACETAGIFTCEPGEVCCNGTCETGSCN
jgi:hypothetical protein